MKIREGHVSNSSSSSFVLVTTKENFEGAKAKCSRLAGVAADYLAEHKRLGNQDIVLLCAEAWDGQYFEFADIEIPKNIIRKRGCEHPEVSGAEFCPKCGKPTWTDEEEATESIYDAWYDFREKLRENEDQILYGSLED